MAVRKRGKRNEEAFRGILLANANRERWTLSRYACRSYKGSRKHPENEAIPDRENIRPIFFHDTDRIIHSPAYSRYIDKTQVFYLFENDHITHRVLHVQFVSKIGRVIGRCLGLNEDLIEAIALGHDLGHVPYGHDGERVLHRLCQESEIGCFCHNAQSVRFLMEIEEKGEGLNLSLQVLDGILAHNGEMLSREYHPDHRKTWKKFEEEYQKCLIEEDYSKKILPMTLEGCVVRISDVIAYAGRDIEDAIAVKLIRRRDIPQATRKTLGASNDRIINNLVLDLIRNSYGKDHLVFSADIFEALRDLLEFNYDEIYFNEKIKTQTEKIERMYEELFKRYLEDLQAGKRESAIYREFLDDMAKAYSESNPKQRIVVDFIAGMTDDFFNNQYNELFVPQSFGYHV